MFTKTLLPNALRALKLTSQIETVRKSYLAGGTALALLLGHRLSEDLDFFTLEEFDEKVLSQNLKRLPEFKAVVYLGACPYKLKLNLTYLI